MWKKIRVFLLLVVLVVVGINAWRDYHQDWKQPIIVQLHPINADGQASTERYIQQLSAQDLKGMQSYLQDSSAKYPGRPITVYFQLGRQLTQIPPKVPEEASVLDTIVWSLKFRFYAWRQHENQDGAATLTLYLNYYDPNIQSVLKHSTALENGRIGSIHLFASKQQSLQNQVIIVHELLHAFGAKDKYDLVTGLPAYPNGYANPDQKPLYPQSMAEIMGGHIPRTESKSVMPEYLSQTLVGPITAKEVGWID